MDERLLETIHQKIREVRQGEDETRLIADSVGGSFAHGVAVGRLYNSFHYQCRRILHRNPTREELLEFIEILRERGPYPAG